MDAFLKDYYRKNKCPKKYVLHQNAISAPPGTYATSRTGVTPPLILPHLQAADAPGLEPHALVGRGVRGAAEAARRGTTRRDREGEATVPRRVRPVDEMDLGYAGLRQGVKRQPAEHASTMPAKRPANKMEIGLTYGLRSVARNAGPAKRRSARLAAMRARP